jgi:hypothetical protein
MKNAARQYLEAGLCVLPARRDQKRPTVPWKQFQKRLPTEAEVDAWFANEQTALCILTGAISGHHEMIDFDQLAALFDPWCAKVRVAKPGLLERLTLCKTQNDGRHVPYLSAVEVGGSMKLAQRRGEDGKVVTLIETRGEGGLYLCAPTPGYEVIQGDLCNLPFLTAEERDILLQCAWDLNEYVPPVVDGPSAPSNTSPNVPTTADSAQRGPTCRETGPTGALRPGDDFSKRGDVRPFLEKHGWQRTKSGENEYWRRPGKTGGNSATFNGQVFYVFSSNADPFKPNQGYSPFAVYAILEHGGNYEQAARSLRISGYGGDCATDPATDADISAIVRQAGSLSVGNGACAANKLASGEPLPLIRGLRGLIDANAPLNPPVIRGLLREGETMNVIAPPKVGKSWLVTALAIAIASGLDWLGFRVEQGRVLHIDNELHTNTSAYRYRVISDAMKVAHALYSDNIDLVSLRGQLRDLYALGQLFATIEPGRYKLIIIDAFYRTLPRDTDENDNGAIAGLYNLIDFYAARLGCAFVLIHHASKGNQAGKAVTDVGAGAGSQSRAADTHLVLRSHEEEGLIVLESAVRSWPPVTPLALRWQWPLFIPVDQVDTSALLGAAKPKPAKANDVPLETFIERCVAFNDPCSQRSVRYEAGRQLSLSERRADEMLDLAIERGRVAKIRTGAQMRYVKARPGAAGDKGLWTAALLAHQPDADLQQVAVEVGVSERYVRQIRQGIDMPSAELAISSSGTGSELVPELGGTGADTPQS